MCMYVDRDHPVSEGVGYVLLGGLAAALPVCNSKIFEFEKISILAGLSPTHF